MLNSVISKFTLKNALNLIRGFLAAAEYGYVYVGRLRASFVSCRIRSGGRHPANGNNGNNGNQDKPTGSDVKKTSTVVKQFVVDFSREDFKPLMSDCAFDLDTTGRISAESMFS